MFYTYLPNVFSKQFCETIIDGALSQGFEKASVNVYGEQKQLNNVRNNERLQFDDIDLANTLQQRILAVAQDFPYILQDKALSDFGSHFRIYQYVPGQYFKPHKDGSNHINGQTSKITVLVYLNDTQGGETVLMPQGFAAKDAYITITPTQGSVLLFEHPMWHEGKPVSSGEKYVLRTDIFYKD